MDDEEWESDKVSSSGVDWILRLYIAPEEYFTIDLHMENHRKVGSC